MTWTENIQEIANKLNRERAEAGGWCIDPSRFHFLRYKTFFVDYEDKESYRCVMPESHTPFLWLPKGGEIAVLGEQKILLGLSFPIQVTVKAIALPQPLEEYITESYKLPTIADFWKQIEEADRVEIRNTNATIEVNGVVYRFDGEVYGILKQILERGYGK